MLHPRDVIIIILVYLNVFAGIIIYLFTKSVFSFTPIVFAFGILTAMIVVTWGEKFDKKYNQQQ